MIMLIAYAGAIGHQKWVPDIVLGGGTAPNGGTQALQLLEVLGAKAAKDLALDLRVPQK